MQKVTTSTETKLTGCSLCGGSRLEIFSKDFSSLYKCHNCGFVMTSVSNVRLAKQVRNKLYGQNYLIEYKKREPQLRQRFIKRLNDIERLKKGGRILDLGCGSGLFLSIVAHNVKLKWELYGLDINKKLVEYAKKKVNATFLFGQLQKQKIPREYFDCVTCFDVLEHDSEINENLLAIKRVLKKKGLLVIQCPNYMSVMAYLAGRYWDWWAIPDHLLHFSPTVLRRLLEHYGFKIVRIFTWEPAHEFVTNIAGSINRRTSKHLKLNSIISKTIVPFLYILWVTQLIVGKFTHTRALIVVYAIKE